MTGYVIVHEGKCYLPDGLVPDLFPDRAKEHNKKVEEEELAYIRSAPKEWYAYYRGREYRGAVGGITTWKDVEICQATVTGTWRQLGTRMISIRCEINGVRYHGRGQGNGMLVRLKRTKKLG